jgi:Rps23 Pro-64 3,4-dihydroxylase Tpa1-like proline 4-hydroxylase
LAREDWWRRLHNLDGTGFELSPGELAEWGQPKIAAIRSLIAPRAGQAGVGYAQNYLRILDANGSKRWESGSILGAFAEFLSDKAVLDLIKTVTGEEGINYADIFASRFEPGDYATVHNDRSGDRKAAFTFGLTKSWRVEWGGLLLFHGEDGQVEAGMVPGFNVLNLFKVPTDHSVSVVAPFAAEPRLALTGWFRQLDGATPAT